MSSLRPEEKERLIAVASLVPALVTPVYGPNSCIPTTRVVIGALEGLGIKARPLSVRTNVINERYLTAVEELGRPFRDKAEAMEWHRSRGVFSYGIGAKHAAGTWPGHLVAVVRERVLLDLTIGQANHPEYDMVLSPIFGEVSGRFLNGNHPASMDNNGCRVIYEAMPRDRGYELTPNWRYADCIDMAREVERRVREGTP
jgi:hypothetical protein